MRNYSIFVFIMIQGIICNAQNNSVNTAKHHNDIVKSIISQYPDAKILDIQEKKQKQQNLDCISCPYAQKKQKPKNDYSDKTLEELIYEESRINDLYIKEYQSQNPDPHLLKKLKDSLISVKSKIYQIKSSNLKSKD